LIYDFEVDIEKLEMTYDPNHELTIQNIQKWV
jgi:hypothetical protein